MFYLANFVSKFETNKSNNNNYEREGTNVRKCYCAPQEAVKQFLASTKQRCTLFFFIFVRVTLAATFLFLVKLRKGCKLIEMNILGYGQIVFFFWRVWQWGQEKLKVVCLVVMHPHHRLYQPYTLNLAALPILKL